MHGGLISWKIRYCLDKKSCLFYLEWRQTERDALSLLDARPESVDFDERDVVNCTPVGQDFEAPVVGHVQDLQIGLG